MNNIEIEKIEDVLKQASKHPICIENQGSPQLKKGHPASWPNYHPTFYHDPQLKTLNYIWF